MPKHKDEQPEDLKAESEAEAARPEQPPEHEPEEISPEEKLAELDNRYRRAVADLANAQKRFQKERERTSLMAVAAFVRKLLPMLDNMSHSLKSAEESHDAAALIEGFRLIEAQMLQTFSESGIRPIESVGKPFDPEVHHAVMPEVTDDVPPGTVTEELGRGFIVGDFVIRPARVKVAAPPPEETDEHDEQQELSGEDQHADV